MIIWINGAFGSGKTQTAYELHRKLKNSFVYDPEQVGYFLRKNMPKEIIQGDFQNQTLWRTFNYQIIKNIYEKYNGDIIIPMTINNKSYFNEIIGKLLEDNKSIDHYILGASKETIIKRLHKRSFRKNDWAINQIDSCVNGFKELMSESIYIDTNNLNMENVVEKIGTNSKLKLENIENNKLFDKIRRIIIQIKYG